MKCNSCRQEVTDLIEAIQRAENGVFHIRGECPLCRAWVKWVPYKDSKLVHRLIRLTHEGKPEEILKECTVYDYKTKEIF